MECKMNFQMYTTNNYTYIRLLMDKLPIFFYFCTCKIDGPKFQNSSSSKFIKNKTGNKS